MEQHSNVCVAPGTGIATRLTAKQHGPVHSPSRSYPLREVAGGAENGKGLN